MQVRGTTSAMAALHRGHQGELFLALGDVAGARRNLRYLELLCGRECAQYRLLRKAVVDAGHAVEGER
jgi:hypothetical protein